MLTTITPCSLEEKSIQRRGASLQPACTKRFLPVAELAWSERQLVVGDRTFRIQAPVDPDQLLEQVTERSGIDEPEPYWAAIWQASLGLAAFILTRDWPASQQAVELGCGLGIVGLAALSRGLDIVLTDYVPEAVEAAIANAHRNGFSQASGRTLDWRQPPAWQVPLVFAADVLYDRQSHEPLLNTLDQLLTPQGQAWIGEPGRSVANDFLVLAQQRQFRVECHDSAGTRLSPDAFELNQFRLLQLTRL
jgi:predicted nicotinamide N-methyase